MLVQRGEIVHLWVLSSTWMVPILCLLCPRTWHVVRLRDSDSWDQRRGSRRPLAFPALVREPACLPSCFHSFRALIKGDVPRWAPLLRMDSG